MCVVLGRRKEGGDPAASSCPGLEVGGGGGVGGEVAGSWGDGEQGEEQEEVVGGREIEKRAPLRLRSARSTHRRHRVAQGGAHASPRL